MTVKDRIALGTLSGIAGSIPGIIFTSIAYKLGYSNYLSFQLSAGIYILKPLTDSLAGYVFGAIIWESMAAILGILTVYLNKNKLRPDDRSLPGVVKFGLAPKLVILEHVNKLVPFGNAIFSSFLLAG